MRALAVLGVLGLTSLGCTSAEIGSAYAATTDRTPVVVELFSSEGCSSCPPADKVLRELGATQSIDGATVIPLELHVDYWNDLGWADPFSSASYSARQRKYAEKSGSGRVYTPQMIVDGDKELVGSQASTAKAAIQAAAKIAHAKVELSKKDDTVHASVAGIDDGGEGAEVWLAITVEGLSTAVPRGENGGSTLAHAPVVRKLVKIGDASGATFQGDASVKLDAGWKRDNARAVVFVQRKKSMKIVGAGVLALK